MTMGTLMGSQAETLEKLSRHETLGHGETGDQYKQSDIRTTNFQSKSKPKGITVAKIDQWLMVEV